MPTMRIYDYFEDLIATPYIGKRLGEFFWVNNFETVDDFFAWDGILPPPQPWPWGAKVGKETMVLLKIARNRLVQQG